MHKLCQRAAATVCEQSPGGPRAGQFVLRNQFILTLFSTLEAKYTPQYSEEETRNKMDLKGTSFDVYIAI